MSVSVGSDTPPAPSVGLAADVIALPRLDAVIKQAPHGDLQKQPVLNCNYPTQRGGPAHRCRAQLSIFCGSAAGRYEGCTVRTGTELRSNSCEEVRFKDRVNNLQKWIFHWYILGNVRQQWKHEGTYINIGIWALNAWAVAWRRRSPLDDNLRGWGGRFGPAPNQTLKTPKSRSARLWFGGEEKKVCSRCIVELDFVFSCLDATSNLGTIFSSFQLRS